MKKVNELLKQRNRIIILRNELNIRDNSKCENKNRVTERRRTDENVCRNVYNILSGRKLTSKQKKALNDATIKI